MSVVGSTEIGGVSSTCRLCGGTSRAYATGRILRKYDICYFRCANCEMVQTEEPYWLEEAYAEAIARQDIGLVSRNVELAGTVEVLLPLIADPGGRFIDAGGGNGMFVRLMRDRGFDFAWHDPYSANLFARGHEAAPGERFEVLTAFEVFEHLRRPRAEVDEMLAFSDTVLFSTVLLPHPTPKPTDWWYFALDSGQHIAFFSLRSLEVIAQELGLHLISDGRSLHILSRERVSPRVFRVVRQPLLKAIVRRRCRRKSLLAADYEALTGTRLT